MSFLRTAAIFSVGYVLGAKAGRERYEKIKAESIKLWNSAAVQKGRDKAKETASHLFAQAVNSAAANVKEAANTAASKIKHTNKAEQQNANQFSSATADEIIVEPIEDFIHRN